MASTDKDSSSSKISYNKPKTIWTKSAAKSTTGVPSIPMRFAGRLYWTTKSTFSNHNSKRLWQPASAATGRWSHSPPRTMRMSSNWKKSQADLQRLTPATEQSARQLEAAQQKLRKARTQLAGSQKQLAELQGRLTGARERAIVLEELERRLDGLSAGVKEVLRQVNEQPEGPFRGVLGVVADLLHVDIDTAPLVEIALGERANHLVVQQTTPLLEQLLSNPTQLPGRAGFLRLDLPCMPTRSIESTCPRNQGSWAVRTNSWKPHPTWLPLLSGFLAAIGLSTRWPPPCV